MVQQQVDTLGNMVGVICLNCTGRKQVKKHSYYLVAHTYIF